MGSLCVPMGSLWGRYRAVLCPTAVGEPSDLDRQIEQLRRCELIRESEVKALCAKARSVINTR